MKAILATGLLAFCGTAAAQVQVKTCDEAGIGSVALTADGVTPRITAVSPGTEGSVSYCLVKVLVPKAINIWVGLPMGGAWNGRWQSVGGGVYAGAANVPNQALREGYAAATTDTGHAGGRPDMPAPPLDGSFGMINGGPNVELQKDFAYRSEHMMAVIGRQLVSQFYGQQPKYSYWNGCSTGGRQGLRMAQDYPYDYDGILAGAPAIHWDRFQAAMLWFPMVLLRDNGGPVGGGAPAVMGAKLKLATGKATAACDVQDGVADGVLGEPRRCKYLASKDATLTTKACTAGDANCLTAGEAAAIDAMWEGPISCRKGGNCSVPDLPTRDLGAKGNKRLWYGFLRDTDMSALGGAVPFPVALEQPRYWVYFDPKWDWKQLDRQNFAQFFRDTVDKVGPIMASDNPDLSGFRKRGGKLVIWHGWSDQLINAQGTVDYYERVVKKMDGLDKTQQFARLFMAPGVTHCAGGNGPQPQKAFESVVDWVEKGVAPQTITAAKTVNGATQTRPLCPWPTVARWKVQGSTDDAANFSCVKP